MVRLAEGMGGLGSAGKLMQHRAFGASLRGLRRPCAGCVASRMWWSRPACALTPTVWRTAKLPYSSAERRPMCSSLGTGGPHFSASQGAFGASC